MTEQERFEHKCVDTIRSLAMDAVQAANSGHPGTPMAMAPVAYQLWNHHMRFDPNDPIWPNRDRFVLSMGHASMLLYAMLHLTGVKAVNGKYEIVGQPSVPLDDLKKFRQLDSRCPGHPEYRWTSGVETTTGPLGQGYATSVGMAMAGKWMGGYFNKPGFEMFDYDVYALGGDGCMQEGAASEAASLAGHLRLDNLCWIYDNNKISIEGNTDWSFSEDVATWVGCNQRAFAYFGGVPQMAVPDNLKAAVTRTNRYEPDINPSYADMARHYGFAVVPARPRKPRDKAKAENGVLLAERWILAALRNRRFTSLAEVREAVAVLLEKLNTRPMRKLGKSRRQLFEEVEKAALKPLPDKPYELAHWKKARVNVDYHVEVEGHCYSVPYGLVGQQVEVRYTASCVEVLLGGRRVASHVRSEERGRFTTQAEHMPASHRAHAQWTPSRILSWAATVGPSTATLVEEVMKRRPHPEQGFRSALGVIRLAQRHGQQRVEKACARAVRHRAYSYKSVAAILQHHLEDAEAAHEDKGPLPQHENVRGADYYH